MSQIDRRTMLIIEVETMIGTSILEAATHMVRISNMLQCITKTSFNGVTTWVFPLDKPTDIEQSYHFALSSGRTIITANTHKKVVWN